MDAISFVLGVRAAHLRGTQLTDLIYRVDGDLQATATSYVKLVYTTAEGNEETEFCRTIEGDSSYFTIDGEDTTWDEYNAALVKLNIIVEAKNFLVFQGDVESIATKSPKALTELFEEISGSRALKLEYEQCLAEKEQAEETTRFNEKKRKGMNAEKMQFDQQMSEADKYSKLVQRKKDLTVDYMVFQLYHIKQELDKYEKVLLAHQKKLATLQEQRQKLNKKLKTKKGAQAKTQKEVLKIEQQIRRLNRECNQERPQLIETKEQMEHMRKRLEALLTSQQDKQQSLDSHTELVADLEEQLTQAQEDYRNFQTEMDDEESALVTLSNEEKQEYNEK